jgi:hypothetical protein
VIAVVIAGSAISFVAGFAIGNAWGQIRGAVTAHDNHFMDDRVLIQKVLSSDRAFSQIEIHKCLDGYACLSGEVDTEADYGRLRARLVQAMGEKRTDNLIGGVRIRGKG